MTEIDTDKLVERLRRNAAESGIAEICPVLVDEAADAILAMAEERDRSEKHRNDLADKITEQSVEIGALKAEVERLREIVAILPIGEMVGRMGWKNWEQARDGLLRALGKDKT